LKEAIASYGLTAMDLGFGRAAAGGTPKPGVKPNAKPGAKARKAAPPTAGVARYRDPKTGATWTGRGRPPAWLPAAGKRDRFLIDPTAAQPPGAAAAKPALDGTRKPRAAAKTGVKAKRAPTPKEPGRAGKKTAARVKNAATPVEPAAAAE
jgi:hypothetical protein